MTRHWTDLTPAQAHAEFGDNPNGLIGSDVVLPLNSMGEECPWPYEPQQLVGAPFGQYHCGYCGEMEIAGVPHSDYRNFDEDYAEYVAHEYDEFIELGYN